MQVPEVAVLSGRAASMEVAWGHCAAVRDQGLVVSADLRLEYRQDSRGGEANVACVLASSVACLCLTVALIVRLYPEL